MGRANKCPGLRARGGVYWIDIENERHGRIYESTGARADADSQGRSTQADQRELAEQYYHRRITQAFEEKKLGVRRRRLFKEAAEAHLKEISGKLKSEEMDQWAMGWALPYIGALFVDQIHDKTLEPLKTAMALGRADQHDRVRPCKEKTINLVLQAVRKILIKCARKYRDDNGRTWLDAAPLITIEAPRDSRPPYPISWDEERKLLVPELPDYIADPCMFMTNTGPRSVDELCAMKWEWERRMPELDLPDFKVVLFVLPATKNGEERVLVLNKMAQAILERQRGKHAEFVWTWRRALGRYHPLADINTTSWVAGRNRAAAKYGDVLGRECPSGFATLHPHDLRHTFGRRLRAAGVAKETRAKLLGHSDGGDMTTHYSAAEMLELVQAVRKIEVPLGSAPTLTVIRARAA